MIPIDILERIKRTSARTKMLCAGVILALIILIIVLLLTNKKEPFAKVRGGNNLYMVHEDLENPELAAETMDKLNSIALKIIDNLTNKYIDGDGLKYIKPQYKDTVKKGIKALKKNFKTANMQENIPERSGGDTSYVINKGDIFAMCLRDPKQGNKVDDELNTLTFVLVHEMSHLAHKGYGHPTSFWEMFRFILQETVEMGLYQKVDYKSVGSPYCGIVVTYSPLYDSRLVNYKIDN